MRETNIEWIANSVDSCVCKKETGSCRARTTMSPESGATKDCSLTKKASTKTHSQDETKDIARISVNLSGGAWTFQRDFTRLPTKAWVGKMYIRSKCPAKSWFLRIDNLHYRGRPVGERGTDCMLSAAALFVNWDLVRGAYRVLQAAQCPIWRLI